VAVVAVVVQVDFATFYSTKTILAVGLWQCGTGGSATNIVWRIPCSKPIYVTYATNATTLCRSTATEPPHWGHTGATVERPHTALGCKFRVRKAADDSCVAPMGGAAAAGGSGAWGLRWLVLVVSVRCVALRAGVRF
jgi:hypothetical protein